MRSLAALLFLCLPLTVFPAFVPLALAEDAHFAREIPDLPLMQGLEELPEAGVAFDKPSGRIVEAYAQGAVAPESVLPFYRATLPQLGWRLAGPSSFVREGERLEIEVAAEASATTVRFTLSPE